MTEKITTEKIACAAIQRLGLIYSLPKPYRHSDILISMPVQGGEQGFITSTGRFVLRDEAYELALNAGQTPSKGGLLPYWLYSEDLW